jgi:predicted nucleotidyltransferase
MWLENPLDDILSSRGKVAVLRVVCSVSVPLAGREIARRAGLGSGHASGILRDLTASGLLLARDQGRANTYEFADPESLMTRRVKDLFAAELERRHKFVEELSQGLPGVVSIVVFGSEARGEAKPGSDTDLLIVVGRKTKRLEEHISDICLQLGAAHQLHLSWMMADRKDLREWAAEDNPFWRNVRAEGVTLAGTPVGRLIG